MGRRRRRRRRRVNAASERGKTRGWESKTAGAYCVDASVRPSGLNAAAIVDLGGGRSGQYVAVQLRNESPSAHAWSSFWCAAGIMLRWAEEEEEEEEEEEVLAPALDEAAPPLPRDTPRRPRGSNSRALNVRHMSCCRGPIGRAPSPSPYISVCTTNSCLPSGRITVYFIYASTVRGRGDEKKKKNPSLTEAEPTRNRVRTARVRVIVTSEHACGR